MLYQSCDEERDTDDYEPMEATNADPDASAPKRHGDKAENNPSWTDFVNHLTELSPEREVAEAALSAFGNRWRCG